MEDRSTADPESVRLSIALQDGFTGDDVIVCMDGREIHRTAAQTAWEISLAGSFEVSVPEGSHSIEMEIPARSIRSTHTVEVTGPLWVGVSVLGQSDVVWREFSDAFGYV